MTQKRHNHKGDFKISKSNQKNLFHIIAKILEKEKYVIVGTYIGIKKRETFQSISII